MRQAKSWGVLPCHGHMSGFDAMTTDVMITTNSASPTEQYKNLKIFSLHKSLSDSAKSFDWQEQLSSFVASQLRSCNEEVLDCMILLTSRLDSLRF